MKSPLLLFVFFLEVHTACSQTYIPFNHPPGNLTATGNGWIAHSGIGTGVAQITSSNLLYTGLPVSTYNHVVITATGAEDANAGIDSSHVGVKYASFLLKVLDVTTLQANTATG